MTTSTLVKHSLRTVRKGCRKCGRNDLYWGHDLSRDLHVYCGSCSVNGKWVMVERDGTLHGCFANGNEQTPDSPDSPNGQVAVITDAKPAKAFGGVPASTDAAAGIAQAIAAAMATLTPSVDADQVGEIVDGKLSDFGANVIESVGELISERVSKLTLPVTVKVEREGKPATEIKGAHRKLADVLTDLAAHEHVMMVGPAGTGKSTIAEHAAEALSLAFYSISLSPQTPASQLLGYMNATGDYVRSLFREAFEHGGVFHFDEFDNGNPSILALINAALANGQMAFPDGMVKRHADFLAVASANTYGRGADRMYVGRQAIDMATLDRFAVEHVDYDESLEASLCYATGIDSAKADKVLAYVRSLRRNAETQKMPVIFSQRASVGVCRLVKQGRTVPDAVASRVRKGLSDADWTKVHSGISELRSL